MSRALPRIFDADSSNDLTAVLHEAMRKNSEYLRKRRRDASGRRGESPVHCQKYLSVVGVGESMGTDGVQVRVDRQEVIYIAVKSKKIVDSNNNDPLRARWTE